MKRSTQADIALLFVVTLWGTSFSLAKEALSWVSPILFVILRFLLAGAIWMAIYGRFLKKNEKIIQREILWRGILLGAVLGCGFIMQTAGLNLTRATMSGFLTGLTVVLVPLFVILLERALPRPTSLAGVAVCAAGLWILSSPGGGGLNSGDLLTIGAAALFALHIVLVEIFTNEYDPRALTPVQAMGVLLVAVPAMFLLETPSATFNWSLLWRWLALGTMVAVTLAIQLYWQRFISATRAGIIFTLVQPLSAVFAVLLLGEVLAGAVYAGGAVIFLGMLVAEGGARLIPSGD